MYINSKIKKCQILFYFPAFITALLLYGIVFLYAATSQLSIPWVRWYTITYYSSLVILTFILLFFKKKFARLRTNNIYIIFITFLLIAIYSLAINWSPTSSYYIQLAPFFMILPYILGRIFSNKDILVYWNLLIFMSGINIFLIFIEVLKKSSDGAPKLYFGQLHSVILMGLILSTSFLVIIARLLILKEENSKLTIFKYKFNLCICLFTYLGLLTIALTFIKARGSIVADIVSLSVFLLITPFASIKRKIIIVFFVISCIILSTIIFKAKDNDKEYKEIITPVRIFLASEYPSVDKIEGPILGRLACESITGSISDRWIHYQTAVALFRLKPIFGVGANRYGDYSCYGPGWYPHSTLMQVAAELGSVGLTIYIIMLLYSFYCIYSNFSFTKELLNKTIAGWIIAYYIFLLIVSQFYGNYFLSMGLYFIIGLSSRLYGKKIIINTSKS